MKISIDTKEDSHEDIRRVIKMLQHLVGEDSYSNYRTETSSRNIFDDPSPSLSNAPSESPAPTNAFSAMFGDNSSVASSTEVKQDRFDSADDIKKRMKIDLDNEIVVY